MIVCSLSLHLSRSESQIGTLNPSVSWNAFHSTNLFWLVFYTISCFINCVASSFSIKTKTHKIKTHNSFIHSDQGLTLKNQLKEYFKVANLLYHLSWLNQINSSDVEFGSLQHFACKVSELYPIPTKYYVRAVGRNYILFLFSFWSGRFMDNIQLSRQLLNSFCNSLKLNLGKVRGSILKLFLTSLCLTRLHYDSPVSSLLIKLVQFVCLMENWCN